MRLLYNPIFTLKINFILKLNSRKSETILDCRIFVALATKVTIVYTVVTFSCYGVCEKLPFATIFKKK